MTKDTVNIHGKEYETVASRVSRFRKEHGDNYSIVTQLVSADEKVVVMKAHIYKLTVSNMKDLDGTVFTACKETLVATGYAEESRTSSSINRTSALENCETSAIGRALAAFGMAGTEYASADEVAQAIHQQNTSSHTKPKPQIATPQVATPAQREFVATLLKQNDIPEDDQKGYLIETLGVEVPLTYEGASFAIEQLKKTVTQTVGA